MIGAPCLGGCTHGDSMEQRAGFIARTRLRCARRRWRAERRSDRTRPRTCACRSTGGVAAGRLHRRRRRRLRTLVHLRRRRRRRRYLLHAIRIIGIGITRRRYDLSPPATTLIIVAVMTARGMVLRRGEGEAGLTTSWPPRRVPLTPPRARCRPASTPEKAPRTGIKCG
jgi:hypothetical protein